MSFDAGFILGLSLACGSGDVDPADSDYEKWLSLPEPAVNQAVFIIRAVDGYMECKINTATQYDYIIQAEGYSIDWGDNTIETFPNNQSSATHTYSESGEYTVIFTNICGDNTMAYVYNSGTRWIMAKYGDGVYVDRAIDGTSGFSVVDRQYLRYIRLPPDTHFGYNFFAGCYSLRKIEFDNIISKLYNSMFNSCYALNFDNLIFDGITEIPNYCFSYCYSMKKIPVPQCLTIGTNAFNSCCSLTNADLPNCETIGAGAFSYCYALRKISAPKCTSIGNTGIRGGYSLRTAEFPLCTSIGNYCFDSCGILANLTLPNDCTYGTNCFSGCYALYPKPDGTI